MSSDFLPVRRALLSVSDKTGLIDLARALAARNVELLSTGGTAYADASAVGNWANVIAVQINMTVSANTAAGANAQPVTRTFSTIVSIRNRNP